MRAETTAAHGARPSPAVRKVLEAELRDARARRTERPRVVDVGGGSGVWAVPFASEGCLVTVVEPNPNALATLERRAAEMGVSDRIAVVADDSDSLGTHVPAGSADLVLVHGLLEVVDDPAAVVAAVATAVAPGGAVSVLSANRHAAVLHRALAGRLAEARRLLAEPAGVLRDHAAGAMPETLRRRLDVAGLEQLLAGAGLGVELIQGDSVISDFVDASSAEPGEDTASWEQELADFEAVAAGTPPLRDLASRLHALARRAATA